MPDPTEPLPYAELLRLYTLTSENLKAVMERDGQLLGEVRALRNALSALLLRIPADGEVEGDIRGGCLGCGKGYLESCTHTCAYRVALRLAKRDVQWCASCRDDHPVLLVDNVRYVLCRIAWPHARAGRYTDG